MPNFFAISFNVESSLRSDYDLLQVKKADVDAALKVMTFAIYHKELTNAEERDQQRKRRAEEENGGGDDAGDNGDDNGNGDGSRRRYAALELCLVGSCCLAFSLTSGQRS